MIKTEIYYRLIIASSYQLGLKYYYYNFKIFGMNEKESFVRQGSGSVI